ncbi:MAG: glycosyltransferase [Lactobacillaceae bacterium]|jgi:glycosyltransferase involved in cell wall biosynthesis|nr:glycosyltransferase [Lactobacillaceae bacterium]
MKILQINSVFGQGSTGRIVADLATQQQLANFTPLVAYGRGPGMVAKYPVIKIGANKFNVYEHIFEERFFDNGGFASRNATRSFVKQLTQLRPDIVHLHNLHGYYVNIELLFRKLAELKCQVILTLHDCWTFSPQSAYIEMNDAGGLPVNVTSKSEYLEYPKTYGHFAKELYQRKKKVFTSLPSSQVSIVTPSDWLTNLAQHSFLKKYSIRTIHNGIDLDNFRPYSDNFLIQHYHLNNKKIILGVANIWEPRKGLKYLNELSEHLSADYQVVIVGRTLSETVSPKIIQIPQTTNVQELAQIYSAADLFVNPTLADNFPTTNIESLASGTPVITFNSGGSSESLSAQTGRVIPKSDSQKLLEICQSFIKTEAISQACIAQSKRFSKDLCYQDYINLYQKIKGGK